MLTKKQQELLLYISEYLQKSGLSPSFDEMKEALDLKSKSGIHRLITALEERGFIRRLPHRARALEVLKLPDAPISRLGKNLPKMAEAAVEETSPKPMVDPPSSANVTAFRRPPAAEGLVSLPLYGKIAAGMPIEALQDVSQYMDIPASLVGAGEHFCLEVSGDSMIEAGIFDGDIAIIKRGETAENGAIIVALVDREEATLKRLRKKGQSIALEPANRNFETRVLGANRVKIQGRLAALFRKY